ncbi:MAG: hypothetical protein ABI451_00135 [Dokdonella sp.]
MNRNLRHLFLLSVSLLSAASCASLSQRPTKPARSPAGSASIAFPLLSGEFDNHEQVWQSSSDVTVRPPHVRVIARPLNGDGWYSWNTELVDAKPPLAASIALKRTVATDGSVIWTPYRAMSAMAPTDKEFDSKQWTAIDACALRGTMSADSLKVSADPAACATVAPGVGPSAALLPLSIEQTGELLRVRLYADQARGSDAIEQTRRVRFFGGWVAINGAGPKATAESRDWHMSRDMKLGSEGSSVAILWRDGKPSGYTLTLERITYREGNIPVLKLSINDERGSTIAYAWANPEATRIGINLGWVQVGLEQSSHE